MAASLLVLAVAFLVGAGHGGIDGGAAAHVEVEGSEVRIQDQNSDLKICRRGYGFGCNSDLRSPGAFAGDLRECD